jgi:hypothetical protein
MRFCRKRGNSAWNLSWPLHDSAVILHNAMPGVNFSIRQEVCGRKVNKSLDHPPHKKSGPNVKLIGRRPGPTMFVPHLRRAYNEPVQPLANRTSVVLGAARR